MSCGRKKSGCRGTDYQMTGAGYRPAPAIEQTTFSWPSSLPFSSPSQVSFQVDCASLACGLRSAPPSHRPRDLHRCASRVSELFPGKRMPGEPILCHCEKIMQHFYQSRLTMGYLRCVNRNMNRRGTRAIARHDQERSAAIHGRSISRAINSETASRSRTRCACAPSTMTSAARGREL